MSEESLSNAFYDTMAKLLAKRLKGKRLEHSLSVSDMATILAKAYGVDVRKARLAGLLHDWDKGYDDTAIRLRAIELDVEVEPCILETMPRLLHAATAAAALRNEFPQIEDDVLRAIERHTSGAIDMSDLDMVVYIADVIEPLRSYSDMKCLRDAIGKMSLEELFLATYKQVFSHLVAKDHRIHPDTIRVWNYYISRARAHKEQE